ncbi:MAG: tetratricopeptide repeat protein [Acidobacteria bacterium]|nr:tetratricopeptide repeat protein [Acidobacteriota bacterium]
MIKDVVKTIKLNSILSICSVVLLLLTACAAAQAPTLEDALEELKQGKYPEAITALNRLLAANPNEAVAQAGLLRAYLETGKYKETEEAAKKFNSNEAKLALAEVYALTGRYNEAINEFDRISKAAKDTIKYRADLRKAELLVLTGKPEQAEPIFKSFIQIYNAEKEKTAEDLTIISQALIYLEKYQDANDVVLEASSEDSEFIEAKLVGGELYTKKYNYAEAADFYKEALEINPNSARTFLGMAANKEIEGGEEMQQALAKALEINPNYVNAYLLRAKTRIDAESFPEAISDMEAALKINPNSLEAHSLKAAFFWLQDRKADYENEVKTVLAINPKYGELYETLSHFATNTRRYAESAEFSKKAMELSPNLWDAHLSYGIALTRLGKVAEGRAEMEVGFKGDPFNVRAKNTLDLLDVLAEYPTVNHGSFILRASAKENPSITPYAANLLDEALQKLSTKYKFTPRSPITVEIYENHEDFAVRTLGLPGLGALGVCFGQVVTLDSPSARKAGEFNWGSTLWHEFTHVITLQTTDNRIPRWFSEGLSVYEERRARPGWGDDWNIMVLKAYAEGRWFRIADLDGGFLRPKTAESVPLAYFQASQVCEFITEKYGFDKILELLAKYKAGTKNLDALQVVLNTTNDKFDREFNEFIQGKVGKYVKAGESLWKRQPGDQPSKEAAIAAVASNPDDFVANFRAGVLLKDENPDRAIGYLKHAIEVFPYFVDEGNPYEALAKLYEARGDKQAQADVLEALVKVNENEYDSLKKLIELRAALGDKPRALEAIKLSFYISPFDPTFHSIAGDLLLDKNEIKPAITEYQVALALKPTNLAEAHYNLARALFADGNRPESRKALLQSLELAPSYGKALELLLKLKSN